MPDKPLTNEAEWPRWQPLGLGRWLNVVGVIVGLVVVVFPSITNLSFLYRAIIALLIIILSWLLFSSIRYLISFGLVINTRIHKYPDLHRSLERCKNDFDQASRVISGLLQQQQARSEFEIDRVSYYDRILYIFLRKKEGATLLVGSRVLAIDIRGGIVMGDFEVTEVRQTEYRARNSSYIDPLWLGYIRQVGKAESAPPPDTIAIHLQQDGEMR